MTDSMTKEDHWLATEYAFGVLSEKQRKAAIERYESESEFRDVVDSWQNHLAPMLVELEPARPSVNVWRSIQYQLFGEKHEANESKSESKSKDEGSGWFASLGFWRGLSGLTGTVAVASLAALMFLPGKGLLSPATETPVRLVASVSPSGEVPTLLLSFDPTNKNMMIQPAVANVGENQSSELWFIPEDGTPRSLGVFDPEQESTINISEEYLSLLNHNTVIAISIEPVGGSPEAGPTGEVIATGPFQQL